MQVPESQEQQRQVLKQLADEHRAGPLGAEVQKILASRLPLSDKIQNIRDLIARAGLSQGAGAGPGAETPQGGGQESLLDAEGSLARGSQNKKAPAQPDPSADPDTVKKNRRDVKRSISPNGLFAYILGDMWKIIPWARDKHVLVGRFFFLSIRMNPVFLQDFSTQLGKTVALPLAEVLRPICLRGWNYLKKLEYNLLALLREIVELVLALDFASFDAEDKHLVRHVAPLEQAFLSFMLVSPDLNLLSDALRIAYRNQPELPGSLGNTAALVQKLFGEDNGSGLRGLLCGLNIVSTKRFLEVSDLVEEEFGALIDETEFDCPEHIQTEIRYAIKEYEANLGGLCKRRDEILKVRADAGTTTNDLDEFSLFYTMEEDLAAQARDMLNPKKRGLKNNPLDSRGLEADRLLPLVYSVHFFGKFIKTISPILVSGIKLGVYPVQLFHIELFKPHIDAIESRLPALIKLAEENSGYPMIRFLQTRKANPETLGGVDREILQQLSLLLTESEFVLSKLRTILRKHRPGGAASDTAPIHSRQLSSISLTIPRSLETIEEHEFFMGKSISEMLAQISDILAAFLSAFSSKETDDEDEMHKLSDEISRISANLARLTTPEHYAQLRRKFHIA